MLAKSLALPAEFAFPNEPLSEELEPFPNSLKLDFVKDPLEPPTLTVFFKVGDCVPTIWLKSSEPITVFAAPG
jgi:hypothetical protein